MRDAGTPVSIPECDRIEGLEERIGAAMDGLRDYGLFCFLKNLAKKTKLLSALQGAAPSFWEELCMLGFYLIASDKPLMYMLYGMAQGKQRGGIHGIGHYLHILIFIPDSGL
jgi:hypothetical protein